MKFNIATEEVDKINEMLLAADKMRGCDGKVKHTSETAANKEIRRLINKSPLGDKFNNYICKHCGFIHVGHVSGSVRSKMSVTLLLSIKNNVLKILGFTGHNEAYRSAMTCKIKGLPTEDGIYVYEGSLIFSTKDVRTIVGNARSLDILDDKIIWRYYNNKYDCTSSDMTDERIKTIG